MITSTSNPQIKELLQMQKKAKVRNTADVFIVEGIKMFLEVPQEHLVQTFVSESFYAKHEELFHNKKQVMLVSDRVFETISDTKTPQGVLCLVKQYHYSLEDLVSTENPLVMVLENLQDPGNLGTILRTGEGAGITGVLLSGGCVDLYNPKVIRSTMGSVYRVPFYYTDNLKDAILQLKKNGLKAYAAHLKGTDSYDVPNYTEGTAFLIGNESKGLTDETAALADTYIRIPMEGKVESLNAAVASSILMYEANRQRRS